MNYLYLSLLPVLFSTFYSAGLAQRQKEGINFDPETGHYTIVYWSERDSAINSATYIPGDNIHPTVSASVQNSSGDGNFRYNYEVHNGRDAFESLYAFEISTNPNIRELKAPNTNWQSYYLKRKSVSRWAYTGGQIKGIIPGDSAIGFEILSEDMPGIVNGYASSNPWLGFPDEGPTGLMRRRLDSLRNATKHVKFKTVGPRKLPDSITPFALLDNLTSYLEFSCDTTWISVPGVCRSLRAKLEDAKGHLAQERSRLVRGVLQVFLNEVESLPEEQLSSEARALLYHNGRYMLGRLEGEQ